MHLLAIVASLAVSMLPTSRGPDFAGDRASWRVVLDGVMGGRSSGEVTNAERGVVFRGSLSLENNGGFSQVRRPVPGDAFAAADGVEITVRGDGRVYIFDLRASNARLMAGSFQREFVTQDGRWVTWRLPFSDFRLHNFGNPVRGPDLEPARIESIGLTLADKQPGAFEIEIASIRPYADEGRLRGESRVELRSSATGDRASGQDEVRELCRLAIAGGVPLFNAGQAAGCAAVYEMALRSVLALARESVEPAVALRVELGLGDGARATSWEQRAWIYREALDAVLSAPDPGL